MSGIFLLCTSSAAASCSMNALLNALNPGPQALSLNFPHSKRVLWALQYSSEHDGENVLVYGNGWRHNNSGNNFYPKSYSLTVYLSQLGFSH